jgi:hypothetical protein
MRRGVLGAGAQQPKASREIQEPIKRNLVQQGHPAEIGGIMMIRTTAKSVYYPISCASAICSRFASGKREIFPNR